MTTAGATISASKFGLIASAQKIRADSWIIVGLCLILALQFSEIFRRGINWDEFHHYNHIWAYSRGELTNVFNVMHSRAFGWVRALSGNAVDHIIIIRLFMFACEVTILAGIIGIAKHFTNRTIGLLCALAYITFPFVFAHGYSFRFDPPSTALMIIAFWMLLKRPMDYVTILGVGALLGIALMVTIKIVLLLPVFAGVLWLRWSEERFAQGFILKTAMIGLFALLVASVIYTIISMGAPQSDNMVIATASRVGGVGSIMFSLEPKPYWGVALLAAMEAPLVAILIALFGYYLYNSQHKKAEKIALIALISPLASLLFYHNTAPYFYVFMMPWVIAACAIPMQMLSERYGSLLIAGWFTIFGVMTYALESESPIEKQRLLIEAAYETFPERTAYFDLMGMVPRYHKANEFMTPFKIKSLYKEGRSIYTEAINKQPVPILLRNDAQFDSLFSDPSNPPYLHNGQPVFTPEDAHVLVDTYIDFWGPFMVAGEVIPEGNTTHDFTIRVPGPYTVKGSDILIKGKRWKPGDVIELDRGHYQVSGPRAGETTLVWGDRLTPPSYPAPRKPHLPTW